MSEIEQLKFGQSAKNAKNERLIKEGIIVSQINDVRNGKVTKFAQPMYIRVSTQTYNDLRKIADEKHLLISSVARMAIVAGLRNGLDQTKASTCIDCKITFLKEKHSRSFRCENCQRKANNVINKKWKIDTEYKSDWRKYYKPKNEVG
jgi:hypothetical protein